MRIPLWLKVVWTACVTVWIPLYSRQYGLQNFLYFCDLGNLFICAGLWLESPLIFSWQATGLLLFQALFTIDLAGALVITPVVILWAESSRQSLQRWELAESIAIFTCACTIGLIAFSPLIEQTHQAPRTDLQSRFVVESLRTNQRLIVPDK